MKILKLLALINILIIFSPMIFIPQEYKEWAIAALAAVSLVLVLSLMWYLADEEELEEYHDEHIPEEKTNEENGGISDSENDSNE